MPGIPLREGRIHIRDVKNPERAYRRTLAEIPNDSPMQRRGDREKVLPKKQKELIAGFESFKKGVLEFFIPSFRKDTMKKGAAEQIQLLIEEIERNLGTTREPKNVENAEQTLKKLRQMQDRTDPEKFITLFQEMRGNLQSMEEKEKEELVEV